MTVRPSRVMLLCAVVGLCFAVVAARLFIIQVIDAGSYAERSRSQSQQRIVLTAPRGEILDCKGRVLAGTVPAGAGVQQSIQGRRVYPHGELAGSVLGHVGKDGNGLAGIEFANDRHLRGEDGWAIIHRDGRNNRYRRQGLPQKEPVRGGTIHLTIDLGIQRIAQSVLKQAVSGLGAKGGMCIIMDPSSGRVLAMADEPAFDPNHPGRFSPERRQNRCTNYTFEPGSTFKVITAASALQEGVAHESTLVDGGNGTYTIYNEVIRDRRPFGLLTFGQAMSVSSNVCFARIADKIGNDRLYRYVRDFGFGAPSGAGFPGEERGIVRPVEQWSGRTRVTMAMGQELSVTLLQMVTAFCAVANGGILLKPYVCEKVVNHEGTILVQESYAPVRRVLSEEVSRRLRTVLTEVVETGTGKAASLHGIAVAGKTGTSQKIDPQSGTYFADRYWSSFIGFVPADNPVLVCGIVIDEPGKGQSGGEAAAPAFRNTLSQIISSPELRYAELILPGRIAPAAPVRVARLDENSGGSVQVSVAAPKPAVNPRTGSERKDSGRVAMPDVIGEDLAAAILLIARQGLLPYVHGSGSVRAQVPAPGTLVRPAEVCTVYCSFDPVVQARPNRGRG